MLTQIHIRDLATILELHLQFKRGTTIISGETGAGKSVFIEAIEIALGGRASSQLVRPGKDKADISLCFDISDFTEVKKNLEEVDLFTGPECIIRRVITSDGRSRCYVNGTPVTLQFTKELGEHLFHLHSQHEQQILLKSETQRNMLDHFADHMPLANEVFALATEWKSLQQEIISLREKTLSRSERSQYLQFQLDELQAIDLQTGEWEKLEAEQHRLAHIEELIETLKRVITLFSADEEQTVLSLLNETRKSFETIASIEPKTNEWLNTIEAVLIQVADLESTIKNYLERIDLDPEKREMIEQRVRQIFDLSRKHKIAPNNLIEFKTRIQDELKTLLASDEDLQKLEQAQAKIYKKYQQKAQQLSTQRTQAANKLSKEITAIIRSLSLPKSEFHIALDALNDDEQLSLHGKERVVFLIKTNPDQNLQPLAKIVSGGELSRLSLALHLSLATKTNIPTLIFDEIDTGLGGATAEKIGKLLRKLGETYQVFCITHQAQVAACGHHHLLVEKNFVEQETHTQLHLLNAEQKALEIARMLGGEKITEKTIAHAKEILQGT